MSNPSNLYAEKIYSEHPLVLWALDDKLDYIGLISEAQRNIGNFGMDTNFCHTLQHLLKTSTQPFADSHLTRV
jgi:hypothetical protein